MDYWRHVLIERIGDIGKYFCGVCKRGWVLECVVVMSGTRLWVCEECDHVWLSAEESRLRPRLENLQQIVEPADGTLADLVVGGWEQLRLAVDVD
ncbi:hypothetical protein AB0M02_32335 [Actinoplanes sp. NPDC051861]|uniref:hypothetical protein n=1 Tax=Actinoplanes sp. NPDC051861 TaxID=3155170 RepID=UPI00341B5B49